ncbi:MULTISPECIES: hypothetical protein [Streptomyces]|jgi:DHA2 family methylenomycin A resistance protein-like MFS transporter|uniref:hypothetical protein n=1 Tax=Streptomyces TaxID=1883 RepID=UPI0019AFB89A|nr:MULTISPECIES: hypothetical protein [Streptomyces]MCM3266885.1 hypothetical protein [Streptomyces thermoviolaceus]GHA94653.1 hypothetical protein GCM10010512_27640 [Streptomyces thermoviolaceus subsp. thermoviolaceus]
MGSAHAGRSAEVSAFSDTTWQINRATGVALGGSLLAAATAYGTVLRTAMAAFALAYPTTSGLAWVCVPGRVERGQPVGPGRRPTHRHRPLTSV